MKKTLGIGALLVIAGSGAGCGDEKAKAQPCVGGPGEICTIAGGDAAGLAGDEGPAVDAEMYLPQDIVEGPDGNLYVTDWNNHRIRAIDGEGIIRTVAGTGMLGDGPEGPALESDFNHPTSMTFGADGRMYLAAWHNSRIKVFDPSARTVGEFCGTSKRAYSGDRLPAETADLDLPSSVAFSPAGDLYVLDQANQVIRMIDSDGNIQRFAGQCIIEQMLPVEVRCADGQVPFDCPENDKLTCLPDTDLQRCNKPCFAAFAGDDGPALEARFGQPVAQRADPGGRIVFDAAGNLYLADTLNNRIRMIDTDGIVTTVAGTGEAGYSGDGGAATDAQINHPIDVDVGPDGQLYFTDHRNHCVRAIDDSGNIRTVAGVCGERGFEGDGGLATDAIFNEPYGIGFDADGNLYVVDTKNHRIRMVAAE